MTEIDQNNRKIYLSVVDYFKNRESAELKAWMDSHKPGESGTTIGEATAPKKKATKKKAADKPAEEAAAEEAK